MKWEYVRGNTSEAQSPGAAWNPQEPDSPGRRSLRRDDPVFYICLVFPSVPRWYVRITQNSPHQQVVELNQDRIVPELTGQTPLVWPRHWAPSRSSVGMIFQRPAEVWYPLIALVNTGWPGMDRRWLTETDRWTAESSSLDLGTWSSSRLSVRTPLFLCWPARFKEASANK